MRARVSSKTTHVLKVIVVKKIKSAHLTFFLFFYLFSPPKRVKTLKFDHKHLDKIIYVSSPTSSYHFIIRHSNIFFIKSTWYLRMAPLGLCYAHTYSCRYFNKTFQPLRFHALVNFSFYRTFYATWGLHSLLYGTSKWRNEWHKSFKFILFCFSSA